VEHSLEYLTYKINEILEPYLTRDKNGSVIEKFGFLRKARKWPKVVSNKEEIICASWAVVYEIPPEYESSGQLLFEYYSKPPSYDKDLCTGYYVGDRCFNNNLEEAIKCFEEKLDKVPKREG
jgi:hypothetical protein